jgi:hypothetical protein
MTFHGDLAIRFLPAYSDSEVIEEDRYDWSRIPVNYSIENGVDEFRERFWDLWRVTGQCPDPAVYSIDCSDWLPLLHPVKSPSVHYIICGHSNYIEMIAKGFSWRLID